MFCNGDHTINSTLVFKVPAGLNFRVHKPNHSDSLRGQRFVTQLDIWTSQLSGRTSKQQKVTVRHVETPAGLHNPDKLDYWIGCGRL